MKKILASTFLFILLQPSSFLDSVFACDKQTGNDTVCSAVAVTRERTASFIFPKMTEKTWTWYRDATKDTYLEYLWDISLGDGENPPMFKFGAYLFKFPGKAQRHETLEELLMTAQHSVVERSGNSCKDLGDLEVQIVAKDGAVHVLIEDPETFDVLFASKPSYACFQFSQPDKKKPFLCRTKIEYRAGSDNKDAWSIGKSPEEIVMQYCILDFKGKRLSSETWNSVSPLVTWRDEPGWDTVSIFSSFYIVSSKIEGKNATVVVKYHILGSTDTVEFKPLDEDEILEFSLVNDNGIWKINAPIIAPHLTSGEIIKKYLRNLETGEPARKSQLESIILKIEGSADRHGLIAAAKQGEADIVQTLIDKGVDVNAKGIEGWTALLWAASKDHTDVVRLLVGRGADVDAKIKEGWTALLIAADKGYADIVHILTEKGADINAKVSNSWTALMLAARKGHPDIVRILVDNGADINVKDKTGRTALMWALENGHSDVVQVFKEKLGAGELPVE